MALGPEVNQDTVRPKICCGVVQRGMVVDEKPLE
jgi:hypothetical protein